MTLGRRVLILASAAALALGLPSLSRAQSLTGSISGQVADAQGGMLPGADVTLTNQESKTVQRTVTNNDGVFVFASVPAGTYGVRVELSGFTAWEASFVDGAGGQSVTERMWQRMRPVTDGAITVTLKQTADAMRLIAEKSRTIAEGAGALSLAAALSDPSLEGPIVCVVSGGNIDLAKFAELVVG